MGYRRWDRSNMEWHSWRWVGEEGVAIDDHTDSHTMVNGRYKMYYYSIKYLGNTTLSLSTDQMLIKTVQNITQYWIWVKCAKMSQLEKLLWFVQVIQQRCQASFCDHITLRLSVWTPFIALKNMRGLPSKAGWRFDREGVRGDKRAKLLEHCKV